MDAAMILKDHSGEITIFLLAAMVMLTLLILVPQLLRSRSQSSQFQHAEHMKALETGKDVPVVDVRSVAAGRTTVIVPGVVTISAATVTCFLTAYRSETLFSVALAVWSVAGVISLAAITGGVALMGRLAQLEEDPQDEDVPPPLSGP